MSNLHPKWDAKVRENGQNVFWAKTDDDHRLAEALRDFADSIDPRDEDGEQS